MPEAQTDSDNEGRAFLIGAVVGIVVLTIALVAIAIVLAINADRAGPAVEIVRDLLIIALVLELVVIAAAVVVFIVQVARFVNLLNNEIQPIITSTQDTVNVVRGTAVFISKNAVEPLVKVAAAVRGIGRVLGDIDAISKAAGLGAAAAAAMSGTGARSEPHPSPGDPAAKESTVQGGETSGPGDRESADHQAGQSSFVHGFE